MLKVDAWLVHMKYCIRKALLQTMLLKTLVSYPKEKKDSPLHPHRYWNCVRENHIWSKPHTACTPKIQIVKPIKTELYFQSSFPFNWCTIGTCADARNRRGKTSFEYAEENLFLLVTTHFSALFFLLSIGGCFEFGWWKNLFSYPDREKLQTFFSFFDSLIRQEVVTFFHRCTTVSLFSSFNSPSPTTLSVWTRIRYILYRGGVVYGFDFSLGGWVNLFFCISSTVFI